MAEPPREPPPPSAPPPPPPTGEPAGEPERRCPRCQAPYDLYQEYCLECGLRLVPLPGTYVRRDVWSRDSPIWLWAALAALLLVALVAGAIVAVAATQDDDDGAGSPVVTTGPGTTDTIGTLDTAPTLTFGTEPTTTAPPTTTTIPPTTTIQPTTTLGTTTTTTTTTGTGSIRSWPVGQDGYTIVLLSTPTGEGRGDAEAAARRAINRGLPEVGILNSSDYSSLNPGYYVTFTGIYDSESEAEGALSRARSSGFPSAYVRRIAD